MEDKTIATPLPADKMRYLSELTVFQDLSPREMEELNRVTTMSTVTKGRVFYRPEEPGEVLFILKDGRVQLYRISPEGKKLVISTLGPHTLFGEMALLDSEPRSASVTADEDTLLLRLQQDDFFELFEDHSAIARGIIQVLSRRLRARSEEIAKLRSAGAQ